MIFRPSHVLAICAFCPTGRMIEKPTKCISCGRSDVDFWIYENWCTACEVKWLQKNETAIRSALKKWVDTSSLMLDKEHPNPFLKRLIEKGKFPLLGEETIMPIPRRKE